MNDSIKFEHKSVDTHKKQKMKSFWILLMVIALSPFAFSQKKVTWIDLEDVTFESKYYKEVDDNLWFPKFGETVKALEGKEIAIKGYLIPMDVEANLYVLSANPYAACFFCGNAGPESIMSLKFKGKPRRYKLDEVMTFKGKLKLNSTNIDELNYILQDAEEFKP